MASHVVVVDSAFKQTRVKVTPGTYLREVLEEACKLKKLNPESYTLKGKNNKAIDLSQPFRLSGLSAGAKLQLTQASRSAGVVTIALQLPESEGGGRLSDKFPSTTSLWLMLRKYEDAVAGQAQRKLNLTQRGVPPNQSSGSGRLEYEQPILNLLGRNVDSFTDLQKSLSQFGLNSGTALIRLSFRSSGQPLEEAMKDIEQYFSSLDTIPTGVGSSATQGPSQEDEAAHATIGNLNNLPDISTEDLLNRAEADSEFVKSTEQNTSTAEAPIAQVAEKDAIGNSSTTQSGASNSTPLTNIVNGITVYRPPSSNTPAAALQPDDPTIFDPTIDDAKAHQAALQRASRNTRLLSDKELDEQEQARQTSLALVREVTVRVRYPDQSMIELTVKAPDTAADLYGRIMGTLEAAPEPFELRYTGPKGHQVLPNSSSKRLVQDFGFRGKVLVTLIWSPEASLKAKQSPSLKEEYRSKAQDLKVELQSQRAAGEENHRAAMAKKDPPPPGASGKGKGDIEGKLRKFMGFGKK